MFANMWRLTCVVSAVVFLGSVSTASAQWYPTYPTANPCYCPQPVAQTCYRTVPVTEYQRVRQIVKRPIIETKYVDQEVTAYRQVVESRTAEIPTVSYQDITEYQTRQWNNGRWRTRYEPNPRMTPCEYDPRPDLFGFLNRTGYAVRSAFTPAYIPRHEFVPQIATQTVPVTRRVAIRGTRKVVYNVAKLVPYTTTRKVAVNTVRYVNEEVVALRPVTVMRTVPIGTRTTFLYSPLTTSTPRTALQPTPDPVSDAKSIKNSPNRVSNSRDKFDHSGDAFAPKREAKKNDSTSEPPFHESSLSVPVRPNKSASRNSDRHRAGYRYQPVQRNHVASKAPSIVRVSGWRTRSRPIDGPLLIHPAISVAGN